MDSLSIFSLIIEAGIVVQFVMLVLVLMSIYSWTLILSKKKVLLDAQNDHKKFYAKYISGQDLSDLHVAIPKVRSARSSMESIFGAGYEEFSLNKAKTSQDKINNAERAFRSMNNTMNDELDVHYRGLSILAMIASSSPYIGLFGTVWGIMHSFIGLASVKQATIAIVAPGIAEALIATAFGLFAAIPATMAYNRLSSQVESIGNKYSSFIEELFVSFQR